MDPLDTLLEFVARTRYEELPRAVVETSKGGLLSTVAAMIGGAAAPGAREVVEQVVDWGGRPESTIAVHGARVPAPLAALANGVMAHALDYADTQVGTGLHASVSVVPAALAVAETAPDTRGCDLIAAFVLGAEVACRMTLAATRRTAYPWLTTTLFGVFGATVAAGKLLELDAAGLRNAMGIAYSSAAGNRQGLLEGALVQRVQPGLVAQAAVTAVALGRRGVTGARELLDGRYGLYPSHYGTDYAVATLAEGLGHRFHMLDVALKAYPCCSYSQEAIEATLDLMHEHALEPGVVTGAAAWVGSTHAAGLVARPYTRRGCPQVDAQFSLPYVIAAAITRRTLGLSDFAEPALSDPAVVELSTKVEVLVDPVREGTVELRLVGGRTVSRQVKHARGHPFRPLTRQDLLRKLDECADHAGWPSGKAAALAETIDALEAIPVPRLAALLA